MENDNQTSSTTAVKEVLYEGIPVDDKDFPTIKIIEMGGDMDEENLLIKNIFDREKPENVLSENKWCLKSKYFEATL